MQKVLLLVTILGVAGLEMLGQTKSHFTVQDSDSCSRISFKLISATATCDIRTRHGQYPINILGKSEEEYVKPSFGQHHEGGELNAWLNLKNNKKRGLGSTLSSIFSSKKTDMANYWNIYLSDVKPYRLDLSYGLGKSYVDLSDIAVEHLKLRSGNAHVKVGYHSKMKNLVEMDTFLVDVDLGDVEIDRLNLSRARVIMAEVGIGSLVMDFEEEPEEGSEIWARVGAGTLAVKLPQNPIPVMIRVKNASYRKLKLPKHFEKIRDNVYVSSAYDEDASNLLTFNIDLSMGNVVFSED